MYILSIIILFCMFVFFCSENSFALITSRCFDCVSLLACNSGKDFARRWLEGTLPPESTLIIYDAICGFDINNPLYPKVCCSDFPKRFENWQYQYGDSIETHPNIELLPLTSCGRTTHIPYTNSFGSRIIRGRTPELYELPWMTLIAYNTRQGMEYRCGGSVINSRYILTAAHCVTDGRKFNKIAGVRIGDFDYSTPTDCQGDYENRICESRIQDIEVEEIIPYESFTGQQPVIDDIALLRLKKDIVMTNNAAPICLPVYSELRNTRLAGKNATIAGWGVTEKNAVSTKLVKAEVPILSGEACSHYYNTILHQRNLFFDTINSFCAGDMVKDSCYGDSGGPLILESDLNNQVRMVQYGIVSFGPTQCGSRYPGVYTDVTKYLEWILDKIRA